MSSTAALELIINLQDRASGGLDRLAQKGGFLRDAFAFATGGLIQRGIEGIGQALGGVFSGGMEQANQAAQGMAQLDAVLTSTGGKAGVTKQMVLGLANSLAASNGLSRAADDAILAGENLLLTFTTIGKDVFPAATQSMLDMATAMNGGAAPSAEQLSGVALQLGKALQDPERGITALSRAGVSFSESQKEVIKQLVATGRAADAQKMILSELNKEFGGSAAASAQTFAGQMDVLREKFANVQQSIGEALMPGLQSVVSTLASPEVMGAIQGFASGLATGLSQAIQGGVQLFQQFGPVVMGFFSDLMATVGPLVQQIGQWFMSVLPTAVSIGVGVFNEVLVPAFQAVSSFVTGTLLPAVGQFVEWLGGWLPQAAGVAAQFFQTLLLPILQTVANIAITYVVPAFQQVADWLGSRLPGVISTLSGLWQNLQPIVMAVADVLFTRVLPAVMAVADGIIQFLTPVLETISEGLALMKQAWEEDWLGIRTITVSVLDDLGARLAKLPELMSFIGEGFANWLNPAGQALEHFKSQTANAMVESTDTAVRGVADIASSLHWLATRTPEEAFAASHGFTTAFVGPLLEGVYKTRELASEFAAALGSTEVPAALTGYATGYNYTGSMIDGINANLPQLNAALQMIQEQFNRAALAFKHAAKGSPEAEKYGRGLLYMANQQRNIAGLMHVAKNTYKPPKGVTTNFDVPNLPAGAGGGGGGGGGSGAGAGSGRVKSAVQSAIEAASDMTSKISGAVQAGIEALGKLGNFTLPKGFAAGVERFAQGVNALMMRLQQVALGFKVGVLQHTSLFVDTAGKAVSLVGNGVEALGKLGDFRKPADGAVNSFVDAIEYVIGKLGDVARKWSVESLAVLGLFADSTGKAMDMVSKAVESLSKLGEFRKPSDEAMQSFVDALDYLTDKMRRVIARWDTSSLALAAQFGESIGKLVGGLGAAIDTLSKLVDFKRPMDDAIDGFFGALDEVVPKVSDRARQWYGLINEGVAQLAGYVGTAVNGILGAIDGLLKLAGSDGESGHFPLTRHVDAFFNSLDLVAPQITNRARQWYGLMNEGLAATAGYIGSAISGLLGALDGLLDLGKGNLVMPGLEAINAFFDALDDFVPLIDERLRRWYGLINESSTQLAGYVGSAVQGVLGALEPLSRLVEFKKPAKEQIDAFFEALTDFLREFGRRAADFAGQASVVAAELATRVGTVAENIGKAIDPILKLPQVHQVSPESIEGAMYNLWFALDQMRVVMQGLPTGFATQAQEFASKVSAIFTSIKAGMDVAASIAPQGTLADGFSSALSALKELVAYMGTAEGAVKTFTSYTATMRDTWVEAMRLMAEAAESFGARAATALGLAGAGGGGWSLGLVPIGPRGGGRGIHEMAKGGDWWVTKPTLFLAGERGPERATFTPMGKGRGGGGGGFNMYGNIVVNAGPGVDADELARQLVERIDYELGMRRDLAEIG